VRSPCHFRYRHLIITGTGSSRSWRKYHKTVVVVVVVDSSAAILRFGERHSEVWKVGC